AQTQLVVAAIDVDAATVEHRAHRAIDDVRAAIGDQFSKISHLGPTLPCSGPRLALRPGRREIVGESESRLPGDRHVPDEAAIRAHTELRRAVDGHAVGRLAAAHRVDPALAGPGLQCLEGGAARGARPPRWEA